MISLKRLLEQHIGGAMTGGPSPKPAFQIAGKSASEVHNYLVAIIKKNPQAAQDVLNTMKQRYKDLSLLQTYVESAKYNTVVDPKMGTYMIGPKMAELTQAFIDMMSKR